MTHWGGRIELILCHVFFVVKQETAYEVHISDWSADECSSDRGTPRPHEERPQQAGLLALGSMSRRMNPPSLFRVCAMPSQIEIQWRKQRSLADPSCGGSLGFRKFFPYRVPFCSHLWEPVPGLLQLRCQTGSQRPNADTTTTT